MRKFIKKVLLYFLNTVEKRENVIVSGFSSGLQNVIFEGKNVVPEGCNFSGKIKIGYATTLGSNNLLGGIISIGKYCQLGVDVAIHATNHPLSYMSTYINQNLFQGELKQLKQENKISIGHDVWIGHGVIIVGNVTIGNGAILAAGSVVTKDILPYAIVAGVPAKEIRKRFSDKVINEIETLKWWGKSEAELEEIKLLFFKDFTNKHSIYD
ncbi:CatB-related O-acetyltransferase [Flavobacterium sp. K5-23]|uniref:CatB-related O-acetyltransferase n=1 Tax=Flavobacterium sp. K5-23 TaxID=2746225 RepID=UPI00200BD597|nr:CatB-related O-acetyltransferase [Flavobacterium sp. K5-23]UQD56158.1 CatB-related O-acetyltransferase [Flavobacterium sp. K5-23]